MMPRFDKCQIKELKEFLYNSYVHDAKLERIRFEREENSLIIEMFNPIYNVKISLTFRDVEIALGIRGDGTDTQEVISITVEEDESYLWHYIQNGNAIDKGSIYLLIQLFSGDEIHIASRAVTIETGGK